MIKKRIISLILFLSLIGNCLIVAQSKTTNLYPGITDYLKSLNRQPVDTIISKIDRLIDNVSDTATQSKIAGIAFDYYSSSPVMGHETVAVYLADNYFLNKRLKWSDEDSFVMLYTYAEFNRESLLGKSAQELVLEDINGHLISLRNCEGEYKVLYFYDDKCSSCKEQTEQLSYIIQNYKGIPITLLAVYTQGNKDDWHKYVNIHFSKIDNPAVTIYHLWDPEAGSLFHKKYSVLSTPAMFLIDRQNIIIGRKLDCNALSQLLDIRNNSIADYHALFDNIFSEMDPVDSATIAQIATSFEKMVGKDSALYRESFYELYKYLKSQPYTEYSQGAYTIANQYIINRPKYWSVEFVEQMKYVLEMYSKNMIGSVASDLVLQDKKGRDKSILGYSSRYTILFFHIIHCSDCNESKEALKAIYEKYKRKGIRVIAVYTGENEAEWRKFIKDNEKKWVYLWDENKSGNIHEKYDVLYVPKIYLLDKDKVIIAKDITAETLDGIIESMMTNKRPK